MKKVFLVAALCVSMVSVVSAYESKMIVSFDGYSSNLDTVKSSTQTRFLARIYNQCPITGLDVVWGGSAYVSGSKLQGLAFTFVTGVAFMAPLLGQVELLAQSGKSVATDSPVSLFHTWCLNKNVLYNLTDKIQLGLTLELLKLSIADGNSYFGIMSEVKPVVAMNVSLF